MAQDTKNFPQKIAVLAFGGVGKDTMNNLRKQYPNAELVVWNREGKKGTGAAILSHQAETAEYAAMTEEERRAYKETTGSWRYSNDVKDTVSGADFAIVAGGPARKDGESREDLIGRSIEFLNSIIPDVKDLAANTPDAVKKTTWLLGTNPLDLMAPYFAKETGIDPHRLICPLGGELDFVRLEQSISLHLRDHYGRDIKPWQIRGVEVIGEHGPNDMVPVFSNIIVDVNDDGHWQKLYDLVDENGQRVVDKIVKVPNPKTGKEEERTMLAEFERATREGGTIITNLLGSSNPETSGIINAYTIKRIVNAMTGKETKDFNASFPVDGYDGVFLSQRLRVSEDGTITPVAREGDFALDDTRKVIPKTGADGKKTTELMTEKEAWEEAVVNQEKRWQKLPSDLEKAAAAKAAAEAKDQERKEKYPYIIKSVGDFLKDGGHKTLLFKAHLKDLIGAVFGEDGLKKYEAAMDTGNSRGM